MEELYRRSGQNMPDHEEWTPKHQGVRLGKVKDLRRERVLPDLQSWRDGVCVELYLH